MATFIPYLGEEEQLQELWRGYAKLRAKGKPVDEALLQEGTNLIQNRRILEILDKIADDHQSLFEASSQEIESFFLLALQPLLKAESSSQTDQFITKLLSILTATADDKILLRLRILGHMYNILDNKPQKRYDIFLAIVKFAGVSKHVDIIAPHLKDIEKKTKEWGINKSQGRELIKTVRNLLKENNRGTEAYKWTLKYLSSFENSYESEDVSAVQQEAVQAIVDAIKSPSTYQFDNLLDLFIVKQLENSTHSKVFQLLRLFVHDTVEAFTAFNTANPGLLQSLGLNEQECLHKIRLLSLATIGAAQQEVGYSVIAKTLQVEENEVETWVILGVTDSVVAAKLDQLRSTVTFTRSLQRVFSRAQWKQLSDTLNTWKGNMNTILKTLQDCKQQQVQHFQQLQQQQQQQSALSQH